MDHSTGPVVVSATFEDLVRRAGDLCAGAPRTILGIVGSPGSGKSTVSAALDGALGDRAVVAGMDGFHLANEVLIALEIRQRKGAPDTFDVPGYVALLNRLRRADEDVTYAPRFDRNLEESIGSAVPVPRAAPLVITEGNYLLHDAGGWQAVRPLLDEVWFLDIPADERVRRLVARRMSDGDDAVRARSWVDGVDEANASVVLEGRERADLVVHLIEPPP